MHLEVPRRENMEEKALILETEEGLLRAMGRQENGQDSALGICSIQ